MADFTSREKVKAFIARRYNTRVHMSLILMSCGLMSMVASWSLLHAGVNAMLLRYPAVIALSYGTFLMGVWIWLRVTGMLKAADAGRDDGLSDVPDQIPVFASGPGDAGDAIPAMARGGGSFDGGGASASFADARAPAFKPGVLSHVRDSSRSVSSSSSSSSSSSKGGLGLDIDGDGLVLLVLAALLVLGIFLCSGYLVYTAPDVLTEAAFGATLTGTLSGAAARHSGDGWVSGVVRKTWWPFAVVLALAVAFAWWSATHYPHAHTFRQAVDAALHGD